MTLDPVAVRAVRTYGPSSRRLKGDCLHHAEVRRSGDEKIHASRLFEHDDHRLARRKWMRSELVLRRMVVHETRKSGMGQHRDGDTAGPTTQRGRTIGDRRVGHVAVWYCIHLRRGCSCRFGRQTPTRLPFEVGPWNRQPILRPAKVLDDEDGFVDQHADAAVRIDADGKGEFRQPQRSCGRFHGCFEPG